MNKTLMPFLITVFFSCLCPPSYCFADKFFEDNDAFFLKYLKKEKFSIDTSASAIVLYEHISYDLLSAQLHIRKIVKIIKKNGSGYADIAIPVFNSRHSYNTITINHVHGITYNLDGGKIVKHEIDKDNIDVERSGMFNEKKISMPAVVEGSIIDYSYDIDNVGIPKWQIQESIPKLYSKFEISIPKEVNLVTNDNILPLFIQADENKKSVIDSVLPYAYTYTGMDAKGQPEQSWVRRNIPSFVAEPYMPCESNYRESMDVFIKSSRLINFEDLSERAQAGAMAAHVVFNYGLLNTWDKVNEALLKSKQFYLPLNEWSASIKEKAHELAGDDTSEISIGKSIFKFVRDSISSSGYTSIFCDHALSKVLSEKSGSSAEINLLLIALLRHAGLSCSPVILVTKDNAMPDTKQPDFFKYNHTICQLRINGKKYYLDAAEKYNPFGRIPANCLNGYARVIDKSDTCGIMLLPDMANDNALYVVTTTNNSLKDYTLNFKLNYSDVLSIDMRTEWNDDTAEIKNYILNFIKGLPFEAKIRQYKVLHLNDPEKQLTLDFSISMTWPEADSVIYFDPYAVKFFENTPFKNPSRKYPVELPAVENLTYTLSLKFPDGYGIGEIPKSGIIKIDEKNQYKDMFAYDKDANTLSVYSRMQVQRIEYTTEEYGMIKEFFEKMVNEQQKNVVIKKH